MYDIRRRTLISSFTVQRPCSSAKVCKKQAEGRPWEWETKHVWPYPAFFYLTDDDDDDDDDGLGS